MEANQSEQSCGALVTPQSGDWTPLTDDSATPFVEALNPVLKLTAELARQLIGSHQSAAALIVDGDWKGMHKYFSLSPKYAEWYEYRTPAVGYGIHGLVVKENKPVRLSQAELQAHPEWKNFGLETDKHPPMRGWLAVPLLGRDGRNYGLVQLSDKYNEADFTEEDELQLTRLAELTAISLDALCRLYNDHTVGVQSAED